MKQDLITLFEQFPGLTVTVSLNDLLTAGRKLSEEIVEGITRERDVVPVLTESADELLTKEETCRKLGVSGTTLWRWAQNGYLSPVKVGVQLHHFFAVNYLTFSRVIAPCEPLFVQYSPTIILLSVFISSLVVP